MHPRSLALAGAVVAALVAGPGAVAQQFEGQAPTFRADVGIVLHSVAVLDSSGRPVTDLTIDEFVVYEDGAPVAVELFLDPHNAGLDVAVVLDSSRSLFPVAAQVRRAARTFLLSLQPDDCVYLLPFADVPGPSSWGLAGDPALVRRVDSVFMQGGTALYDAILDGVEAITAADTSCGPAAGGDAEVASGDDQPSPGMPERRRALVLLTDGADENSARRFDEVLDLARAESVPVFPVALGQARRDPQHAQVLEALAGSTGGVVIESLEPAGLQAAYDDVVALLRASYLLGYRAPEAEDPRWREVEVRSRRPSYRLVHRTRYYR